MSLELFFGMLSAYVIGSLPFGYWIGLAHGKNLRNEGSGNIGATNVIRILGKKWGLTVFALDVLKSLVPAIFGSQFISTSMSPSEVKLLIGLSAVLGHTLSPFLKFRGGKGVAAALGAVLAATPLVAAICLGVWLILMIICGYVSLSSLIATLCTAILAGILGEPILIIVAYSLLAVYIVLKHIPNLRRLKAGQEPKLNLLGPKKPRSKYPE